MTCNDWTRALETSCNIYFFLGGGGRGLIGRGLRTENMGREPRVGEHKYPMVKWDYLTLLYEAIS